MSDTFQPQAPHTPSAPVFLVDPATGLPVVGGGGAGTDIGPLIGATNETAPATDTASAGLNGRLQRVAQRLTTMLTGIVLAAGSAIIGKVGIDQTTPGTTNKVFLTDISEGDYETVAASQADQIMGATGAIGDYLAGVLIVPAQIDCGVVSIKDGSGSVITVFAGGATTNLVALIPFFVPLGIKCMGAGWKVTTGVGVSAIGVGNFT